MANRERGEVSIRDGKDRYTLRPTITAYCELEERVGQMHVEVMQQAARGSAIAMRQIIWTYLQDRHAEQFPEFEDAGRLIDRVGFEEVKRQLDALQDANAPPDDAADARPRTARAGIGDRSTSAVAASA